MSQPKFSYWDRITVDPEIMVGKPVVKGTRIPVALVLKRLAQDLSLESLFLAYPRLTQEDVRACRAYPHLTLRLSQIQMAPITTAVMENIRSAIR